MTDSALKKDKIIAAYDSGIFYADFHFGRLIQGLKKLGLYEKTVVILTGDHGEVFDHITEKSNFGSHGHSLSEPLIRVPLIIGGPEEFESGRKIKTLVSGVDITPTVLDFLGLDYKPEAMRGMSLLPLIKNDVFVDRKGFSSNILGGKKDMEVLRSVDHKLVSHIDVSTNEEIPGESEFYDLTNDPGEKMNITQHDVKKLFESELRSLKKDILARGSLLKKFISSHGKYRDLLNALNIGGYVSATSY
jgi:arylsulfatase A-like enzyme